MTDDRTIISQSRYPLNRDAADLTVMSQPDVQISLLDVDGVVLKDALFSRDFSVGRSSDNDFVISDKAISRHHLVIKKEQDGWWVYDLNSTNGVCINNERVLQKSHLILPVVVSLRKSGFSLKVESSVQNDDHLQPIQNEVLHLKKTAKKEHTNKDISKEALKARLLAKAEEEDLGNRTRMIRSIIQEDRVKNSRKHKKSFWVFSALLLITLVFIVYQQVTLSNARALAIDMFYDIKALEVSLSRSEIWLSESAEVLGLMTSAILNKQLEIDQSQIVTEQERIAAEKQRLAQQRLVLKNMKERYQYYVEQASPVRIGFSSKSHYENELIARVARGFGESELELPEGFVDEVRRYIGIWQQSSRMQYAIARLEVLGYSKLIVNALEEKGLPLYFVYLPLQESNYDPHAIGPQTRFGIAKGAWQFLATTGQEYGLSTGPLEGVRAYDELDERFDFVLATHAGTKYLKNLYSTEAQASGLLVLASYNYGQTRVRQMIHQMHDDPREKNFWTLIQQFDIPKETYDYVFSIFAAAVIGEDPLHFGFGFRSPLDLSGLN
ncbi:MAG: FHA domain-containing protein [Betaproteobacteria bacterium]|nr:FHA domain-containing protein [Betaproteobacteria bacterium]